MSPNSTLNRPDPTDPIVIALLGNNPLTANLLLSSSGLGARAFYRLSLRGMELFCKSSPASQQKLVDYSADPNSPFCGPLID